MRKLTFAVIILLGVLVSPAHAQSEALKERETEWNAYALPQGTFTRYIPTDKQFIVRVPSDWKQTGNQLLFTAPHSSTFHVITEKIPDGLPLTEYVAAMMRTIDGLLGSDVSPIIRRTQLQDLDSREIFFQSPNAEGELVNTTSWVTVNGPLAVAFTLQTPVANVHELEPFLKEIVQSVMFVDSHALESFDKKRATLQLPVASSLKDTQSVVELIAQPTPTRAAIIQRLASVATANTDVVMDLLLDRRPLVRATAIEALIQTNNGALDQFLWEAVQDREPLVALPAARHLAKTSDVLTRLLDHSIVGLKFEVVGRIWPFLTKDRQLELMRSVFSRPAIKSDPPPPTTGQAKPGVSVKVTELVAIVPGMGIQYLQDPNVQLGALTLLGDLSVEDFKLPLQTLIAAQYDPLTIVGLQVANNRHEQLPVDVLLKLASSKNSELQQVALDSLGYSARAIDIPKIEALMSKENTARVKLTVRKIQFRDQLTSARQSGQPTTTLIKTALSDSELSEFAWQQSNPSDTQRGERFAHSNNADDAGLLIKPLGENLFPRQLIQFSAIPNPGQLADRFYESLRGIQMDSARAQSSLVLMMGGSRQALRQMFGAPPDAESVIGYTGIKADAPIALAQWSPQSSPAGLAFTKRRALVLQVNDRARFTRTIDLFHSTGSDFASLTDYIAGGARLLPALPAILPYTARQLLTARSSKPESRSMLKYSVVAETNLNGRPVDIVQYRGLDSHWKIYNLISYVLYIGNEAIISSDLETIDELLVRATSSSNNEKLSANEEFRRVVANGGDIIYFSDPGRFFTPVSATPEAQSSDVKESGSLRILGSTWENSHQLTFKESDWSKYFQKFHPKDLVAPRDLLPNSTIAYLLVKLDTLDGLQNRSKEFFGWMKTELPNDLFELDFAREVAPELGPECGAAVLDLPDLDDITHLKWAIFCKLKTNKLSDALNQGKLLRGVGPTNNDAEIKSGETSYFVKSRNGFLIVSNEKDLSLTAQTSLAATRDYSKAVESVPDGIIAFGGYNLEAAVAAASKTAGDGLNAQIANVIFSLAGAFHSQSFYAKGTAGDVSGKSSVAMDREGRYSVADVNVLTRGKNITFATLEPRGVPILDQTRISSLVMKISSKAAGPIDSIRDDLKTSDQSVEQKSANELILTIAPRRGGTNDKIQLPISVASLSQFLQPTAEFPSDNKQLVEQAKQIAGNDRDAWSVAQKLAAWTYKNLTWKATAAANPTQTLATREADCSEFSALYVSMARALGLPSRIVSGLAYGADSFGGHAWVEVWVGRWIELDPTWGTDFVDATHIRNGSSTLVTAAALNLLDLEILGVKRDAADFQKSARSLATELGKSLSTGRQSSLEASTDLVILTEEFMGQDEWSRLSNDELERLQSGQRKALLQLSFYNGRSVGSTSYRFIHLNEQGNRAEALFIDSNDELYKMSLINNKGSWYLVDIVNTDTGIHALRDVLTPIIRSIEDRRAGKNPKPVVASALRRARLLISDPKKAATILDSALKEDPKSQELRLLKADTLFNAKETDHGFVLLKQLANEEPAYPPALYELAKWSRISGKEDEKQNAPELFTKYIELEPNDPRGHDWLAFIYVEKKELDKAEAEFKKALDCDPDNFERYFNLIHFLAENGRTDRVGGVLESAKDHPDVGADLFGDVVENLHFDDETELAEKLAASQPGLMKTSLAANISLARMRIDDSRPLQALPLLALAIRLDKKSIEAYLALADAYHSLSRWPAALRAVDTAIALDEKNAAALYERARILARLSRAREAIGALRQSIELNPDRLTLIRDENDFRILRALPAFKEMVAEAEKAKKESNN